MDANAMPGQERASLVLAKLNAAIENRPVFLALSETFAEFADAIWDRAEKQHLRQLSENCYRRYERQKAWVDVSPTWERDFEPVRGRRQG